VREFLGSVDYSLSITCKAEKKQKHEALQKSNIGTFHLLVFMPLKTKENSKTILKSLLLRYVYIRYKTE